MFSLQIYIYIYINLIHSCSTYVRVSVSVKSTVLFPSLPSTHLFSLLALSLSLYFILSCSFVRPLFSNSIFLNECNNRRQNRRITEIIRFNYIYIYFCLSWINSSILDSHTVFFFAFRMISTSQWYTKRISLSICAAWSLQFTQQKLFWFANGITYVFDVNTKRHFELTDCLFTALLSLSYTCSIATFSKRLSFRIASHNSLYLSFFENF